MDEMQKETYLSWFLEEQTVFENLWDPRSSQTLNDRGCRNICLAMATGGTQLWHLWPWFIVGCFNAGFNSRLPWWFFNGLRRFKMPGMACQHNRSWFEWWKVVPWLTKIGRFRSWNEHFMEFQCQRPWDGARDPHDPDVSCGFIICRTCSLPLQPWFCWTSSTFCWTQCYWWWVCRTLQVT